MTVERIQGMEGFDGLIPNAGVALKEMKEKGKKVVGFYCTFAPQELVLAIGAIPVPLCATKEELIAAGEKTLPRNFCPLIKSSYGFAVTDKCPYFHFSDLIVGETTCDGKKKMFELMADFKPVHVMSLPKGYQTDEDKAYWLESVKKLKVVLEERFGIQITDDNLRKAIKELNEERILLQRLSKTMQADPVPFSGHDLLEVLWARNFAFDRKEFAAKVNELITQLEERIQRKEGVFPQGAKRIVITGVPTGLGAEKVLKIIEECGAAIVYIENCSGMKQYVDLVDETKEPLTAIAEKYLNIPCSCMSPNPKRLKNISAAVRDFNADGVVDIVWQGCHTYNVENALLGRHLQANGGIPLLHIETDYSQGDVEQLKTRIQAFLEMIG
ncbi:MAG: double-cubane-cluster-containing anaerobic reductase [Veillonellales bacterium]